MTKIRVLLIEDNRLLREGITAMLNDQPDIKAVSSAGNGDAMKKARTHRPQVQNSKQLEDRGTYQKTGPKD